MTNMEILGFVVMPLGIALFGWAVVLLRERRARRAVIEPKGQRTKDTCNDK